MARGGGPGRSLLIAAVGDDDGGIRLMGDETQMDLNSTDGGVRVRGSGRYKDQIIERYTPVAQGKKHSLKEVAHTALLII
ncbi:hypothetical protein NQZ68_007538 [Dissostichus eleginoides]|nr:hypothetical protein NQZ68_007538 [Dissostichus eleginoides]